jgi:AAA15 family ATPase/GTPase
MANFFDTVHISNFKSLKDVTLSDCRRINLLLGKPNAGKSNILEAIALFSTSSIIIRFENPAELFFDGNTKEDISILVKNNNVEFICNIKVEKQNGNSRFFVERYLENQKNTTNLPDSGSREFLLNHHSPLKNQFANIRQYRFPCKFSLEKQDLSYLSSPFGKNLLSIIQEHKNLRVELAQIISEYGWKLNIDLVGHTLRVLKDLGDGIVFTLPYASIADTLQRLIFYKAAIASNENSTLLFEEPEAHCFPPYIRHITQDVINSESNQFFIATHSPYVLNDFLEDTKIDLAIYMVGFQDGKTTVYRLSDEELDEIYNYGIDVFFNYERFSVNG